MTMAVQNDTEFAAQSVDDETKPDLTDNITN